MIGGHARRWGVGLCLALLLAMPALAVEAPNATDAPDTTDATDSSNTIATPTQNGRDVYQRFHDGLADPVCEKDSSNPRWRRHFANAPRRLVAHDDDTLALFGYVVDALREASLPTEYALIPFVESGYKPGARSPRGPAGMWQMIKVTARNHHVLIHNGYDGRLSPVDSTRAAVRYLKTLHGMFAGDWRLAVMAYNAGEYRVFGALKRSGQVARDADPEKLTSLSGITRTYVRKLHALSCLLDRADDNQEWVDAMDRPVPVLKAEVLASDVRNLKTWANQHGLDIARVRRLNPGFTGGHVGRAAREQHVLVPMTTAVGAGDTVVATARAQGSIAPSSSSSSAQTSPATSEDVPTTPITHTVARGESAWTIAHRYGLSTSQLLFRNGLTKRSVLQPGMVLRLDDGDPANPANPESAAGPQASLQAN